MSRVISIIEEYKILAVKDGFIVVNKKGKPENHGHFKKLSTCYVIIRLVKAKITPKSKYLLEAAKRLTLDPHYRRQLSEVNNKQRYNNRGVR